MKEHGKVQQKSEKYIRRLINESVKYNRMKGSVSFYFVRLIT
jgi:hypothetical protein